MFRALSWLQEEVHAIDIVKGKQEKKRSNPKTDARARPVSPAVSTKNMWFSVAGNEASFWAQNPPPFTLVLVMLDSFPPEEAGVFRGCFAFVAPRPSLHVMNL